LRPQPNARRQTIKRLRAIHLLIATILTVMAFGTGAAGAFLVDRLFNQADFALPAETVRLVVERIIQAESGGDPNAKNPRSTATGAAQFIDATWLELIRRYRADLKSRAETELLELRRDPKLAREMTRRFVERNAAILHARGAPITPAALYLSHFAGGAGAAAILLAADDADAAETMAKADSTGKMSREKLVRANPFLASFTAKDLRRWAERKMRAHNL
jgi:hypothetical protein